VSQIKYFISIIFILCFSIPILPQDDDSQKPCSSPEASQFDFWIGEWNVEWLNTDSIIAEGTNNVKSILGSCVIEENFSGKPGVNFMGKSFSVYNPVKKMWQQTWVDDQGGYMVFTGGMEDNKMILSRKISRDDKKLIQRMVFYNISKDEFDWNWESSKDNGVTWKLNWKIHYSRVL
jgi:hypothetical protein